MDCGKRGYLSDSNNFASIETEIRPPAPRDGDSRSATSVNETLQLGLLNTRMKL